MKNKLLLLYTFIFLGPLVSFADCPGDTARFNTIAGVCNSKTVTFVNTSVGATTYFWNFGDGGTLGDTSNVMNPAPYTYSVLGTYTTTLIVDRYTVCADTFTAIVNMNFVDANYTSNAPKCVTSAVNFTDASLVGPGATIVSYKWDFGAPGNNDTTSVQNPSYTYSVGNVSYNVKFVVTGSNGCKDSVTSGIGIQSTVVVNAGTNITTCDNNQTVNLSGSIQNAGGGIWTASGAFSPSATSLTPIYTPTETAKQNGVDTLVLTSFSSPYCPNKSDTVLIIFNPGPVADVGPDLSVCKDVGSVSITATLTGATGGVWHTLSTEGTFTDDSLVTTFYHPGQTDTAAGSVILYLETTGNGICASTRDSLTINFTPLPVVIIKTEDSSCSGNPILLDVTVSTGAGTWSSSGTGIFLPNSTALNGVYYPSAADNAAGMVTLMFVSDDNGDCQPVEDSLTVIIKQSPTANYTAVSACVGSPVQFNDNSTAAGSITNWNWVFGDLSLPSLAQSPSHTYSNCGSKTVTLVVTADNGCIDADTQTVPVYCIPVANYTAIGVCVKEGTEFTNTSTVNNATIATSAWTFGDNTTSTDTNPAHSFPTSGSFPVTLIVTSSDGCKDTLVQTLSIADGPVAAFTVSDSTSDVGEAVMFNDESVNANTLNWEYGDGASSTLTNPTYTYNTGGMYDVCLYATDAFGCLDTACHQQIVSALSSQGPTGFSPNGDGQNDVFYVYGGPFKKLEFKVYNNWGEVIFMSDSQSVGWDGKYKGVDQAVGVYVYTVVGTTENDKEIKISGDVTLLR
jgi:gliding motility-associated-like protein